MPFKRLTIEDAESLIERHGFKLVHNTFGMTITGKQRSCGCAVSLSILQHMGSMEATRTVLKESTRSQIKGYGALTTLDVAGIQTQIPAEYLRGLLHGFDFCRNNDCGTCNLERHPELHQGCQDGKALRQLVK